MILVDTSVWVDFFRGTERAADLAEHLESNLVLLHPWVLGELVLGGLGPRRNSVIADLKRLPAAPLVPDEAELNGWHPSPAYPSSTSRLTACPAKLDMLTCIPL